MSLSELKNLFGNKRPGIIVALGLLGMVLIMVSSFFGGSKESRSSPASAAAAGAETKTAAVYAGEVEQKLLNLIGEIEGVGELRVLVTIENGYEKVYAQSGKSSQNSESVYDAEGKPSRVQQNQNEEHAYVFVENSGSKREALLITQIEPKIKGVVVVCQGADNLVVQERVISAVTTALGISSNRVCVLKKA